MSAHAARHMQRYAEAVGDSAEASLTLVLSEANEAVQSFAHIAHAADGVTSPALDAHRRLEGASKTLQVFAAHRAAHHSVPYAMHSCSPVGLSGTSALTLLCEMGCHSQSDEHVALTSL